MREGTRKSRAPSGLEAVRIGVENSLKPASRHAPADGGDDGEPLHDVGVQRLAAQIQEAVREAQVLRIVGLAEHRDGQLLGRRQHLDLGGEHLDLARRQLGVHVVPSAGRSRTLPSTRITHSERTASAALNAGLSGSATTWVRP